MRIISNTLKRSYEQNLKGILSKKRTEPLLPSVLVTLGGGTPPPLSELNVMPSPSNPVPVLLYASFPVTAMVLHQGVSGIAFSVRVIGLGGKQGGLGQAA